MELNMSIKNLTVPPEGWECHIYGQYFKLGRFGRPYVFRGNEWVITRCTPLAIIKRAIKARKCGEKAPEIKRHYVTHGREGMKIKPKHTPTPKWMILSEKPILDKSSALAARNAMIERMRVNRND